MRDEVVRVLIFHLTVRRFFMEIIIIYLALCVLAGIIAGQKKRSWIGFFMLAVLLSPLVGIIGALIVKSKE